MIEERMLRKSDTFGAGSWECFRMLSGRWSRLRLPFAIGAAVYSGLLAGALVAQAPQAHGPAASDAEWQLEAAIHKEIVVGDLKGAMEAYQAILASQRKSKAVAARALFQLGQCQEKLGQRAAAYSSY